MTDLKTLTAKLRACRHCEERFLATQTRHAPNPVFQLSPTASICIAGQAPGLRAHKATKPFADPSGDRLRAWMNVSPETFYDPDTIAILPMAFCFPGYDVRNSDLPPPADCARIWRQNLLDALANVKLIILVGRAAIDWHVPTAKKDRLDRIVRAGLTSDAPSLLPLPHPSWRNNAWLKANPWFDTETLPALRTAIARSLD